MVHRSSSSAPGTLRETQAAELGRAVAVAVAVALALAVALAVAVAVEVVTCPLTPDAAHTMITSVTHMVACTKDGMGWDAIEWAREV